MKAVLRLLPYLWPHRRGLAVVLLTMALTVAVDVLRPWPTKLLVDSILGKEELPGALARLPGVGSPQGLLLWVCAATVVIFLARAVLGMVSVAASVTFGQRMVYDLGADLFRHLQRLSLVFHTRRPLGDLVSRVTVDTYCLQVLVGSTLLPLLQAVLTLLTMFAIMWGLEPRMTLLSLGVVPLLALLIYTFGGPMKEHGRRRRDLEGHLMTVVQQTLAALPAVQVFTREDQEHDRFVRTAADTVAAYRRSTSVDMWFKLLVGLVTALGTAGIMYLGARYALEGRVTAGTVRVFLAYLACLYEPLSSIVYTASLVQYASANADRVLEILDTPPRRHG
jgi:ATP-binding cassette subfamily B protein/subfamily B ATP-binding cassette protein MsbA